MILPDIIALTVPAPTSGAVMIPTVSGSPLGFGQVDLFQGTFYYLPYETKTLVYEPTLPYCDANQAS